MMDKAIAHNAAKVARELRFKSTYSGVNYYTPNEVKYKIREEVDFYYKRIEKLEFLVELRRLIDNDLEVHKNTAAANRSTPNEDEMIQHNNKTRVIDGLYDEINNEPVDFEPKNADDVVSENDLFLILQKLEILEAKLNDLDLGQEIIHDTVEELKTATGFGKKVFGKYALVKVWTVLQDHSIQKTVAEPVWEATRSIVNIVSSSVSKYIGAI